MEASTISPHWSKCKPDAWALGRVGLVREWNECDPIPTVNPRLMVGPNPIGALFNEEVFIGSGLGVRQSNQAVLRYLHHLRVDKVLSCRTLVSTPTVLLRQSPFLWPCATLRATVVAQNIEY